MQRAFVELLESRLQLSGIQYGVAASGDPDVTGVLATSGPGLKDLGAHGVRLFTDTSFLSSDFDITSSGKIYVRNPSLVTSLSYSKKYHNAGINVTLCIQLSTDRSMSDGSLLTDPKTGASRYMLPSELRSPKVFHTWYDIFTRAQISKTDNTSVTKVIDFWEIGNEVNHATSSYWPVDPAQPPGFIEQEMDSYIDHDLAPAYDVLSKLHEPVIGAGLASGSIEQYNELNNQPGARRHQYSNNCDYLNFHPYGYFDSSVEETTPLAYVRDFTAAMYGDKTVHKPFVITEYNVTDLDHIYPLDPSANPRDSAEQIATARDLDIAHTQLLNAPHVQLRCAWIYYYRLIAQDTNTHGALLYPRPDGKNPPILMTPVYDLVKSWARGSPATGSSKASGTVLDLGGSSVINTVAVQSDGKTLVVTDDGVRRYDAKGKLDPSYGVNGFSALPFICKTAALQGDGNLVVGGSQTDLVSHPSYHLVVTRLTTSGVVDPGFATKGFYSRKGGSGSSAVSIGLRAGKIVIVGQSAGVRDGLVVRLDLAGHLDPTFAGGGPALLQLQGYFSDVSIAKSGAITTLLHAYSLSPQTSIARFNNGGLLDTTFSTDGISDPQPVIGDGMFVDGDGSVTLVGHNPIAPTQTLTRFTPAGAIDSSFGAGGVQTLLTGRFIRGNPVELPDGSRFLYGSIASSLTSDSKHVFVARLSAADQLDLSYGVNGIRTLSSTNVQDLPFSAAINPSGAMTIAAGGFSQHDDGDMTEELFPLE